MATKVKGDKIKEGSIPFSALAEDVNAEIDVKYGLKGYVGKLSSSNTKIESPSSRLYLYIKGKIYDSFINNTIILTDGPGITISINSYGYKTVLEITEGKDQADYFGILVFNKYNPIPTTDLGVDPVQLKYLTNPIVLGHYSTIPEDLYDYNNDDFKFSVKEYNTIYPFIKIKHNNQICDIVCGKRLVGDEMWVICCIAKDIAVYDGGSEIKPSQYRVRCENGVIKISNKLNSEIL